MKPFQPCPRCARQASGEDLHQGKCESLCMGMSSGSLHPKTVTPSMPAVPSTDLDGTWSRESSAFSGKDSIFQPDLSITPCWLSLAWAYCICLCPTSLYHTPSVRGTSTLPITKVVNFQAHWDSCLFLISHILSPSPFGFNSRIPLLSIPSRCWLHWLLSPAVGFVASSLFPPD